MKFSKGQIIHYRKPLKKPQSLLESPCTALPGVFYSKTLPDFTVKIILIFKIKTIHIFTEKNTEAL